LIIWSWLVVVGVVVGKRLQQERLAAVQVECLSVLVYP
jgi:hypothetical protein